MPSLQRLPKYSRAAVWMRIARKRKLLDRVDCGFTLAGAKPLEGETAEAISEAGCEVRTNCKDAGCGVRSSSFRTHSGVREKNELPVRRSDEQIDSSKFVKSG